MKTLKTLLTLACTLSVGFASAESQIVGGKVVPLGDPLAQFTVYISNPKGFCSGTLISPRVVLTAAHCLVDKDTLLPYSNPNSVLVGFNTFDAANVINSKGPRISAERINVNPLYNSGDPLQEKQKKTFDIGLILLSEDAPPEFSPIHLATAADRKDHGQILTLAGYGREGFGKDSSFGRLKSAQVKFGFDRRISKRGFTTGSSVGAPGDSGGPCLVHTPSEGYKVLGAMAELITVSYTVNGVVKEAAFNDISLVTDYTEFLVDSMKAFELDPTVLYSSGTIPSEPKLKPIPNPSPTSAPAPAPKRKPPSSTWPKMDDLRKIGKRYIP